MYSVNKYTKQVVGHLGIKTQSFKSSKNKKRNDYKKIVISDAMDIDSDNSKDSFLGVPNMFNSTTSFLDIPKNTININETSKNITHIEFKATMVNDPAGKIIPNNNDVVMNVPNIGGLPTNIGISGMPNIINVPNGIVMNGCMQSDKTTNITMMSATEITINKEDVRSNLTKQHYATFDGPNVLRHATPNTNGIIHNSKELHEQVKNFAMIIDYLINRFFKIEICVVIKEFRLKDEPNVKVWPEVFKHLYRLLESKLDGVKIIVICPTDLYDKARDDKATEQFAMLFEELGVSYEVTNDKYRDHKGDFTKGIRYTETSFTYRKNWNSKQCKYNIDNAFVILQTSSIKRTPTKQRNAGCFHVINFDKQGDNMVFNERMFDN